MKKGEVRWASDELRAALAQLTSQQAAGVVRIVQAELDGRPLSSLLDCPGQICTSTTYYGSGKRPGWKGKPAFQRALELARRDYRTWALEHGTSEALTVLADASAPAARALRHQVVGDEQALAVLAELLHSEQPAERLAAAQGLGGAGLPQAVPWLQAALEAETESGVREMLITALSHIAGFRDGERRLAAAGILDRAAVETAAKAALSVDEDDVDAAIERELARLAAGSEGALPGAAAGDADAEEL